MNEKFAAGPVYKIFYHPTGGSPMGPATILGGFVIDLAAAGVVALVLSLLAPGVSYLAPWGWWGCWVCSPLW